MKNQMEQQNWPAKFYNIFALQIVSSSQAKFSKFMKLDTHKTLFHKGVQCKYITNLVVAGQSFLKLFVIFQNDVIKQLGSWKIYTKIDSIQNWDKSIVITSGHKIFGLIFQQAILKNSFMINLDFLYLKPSDKCKISTDGGTGRYMTIKIGKYVLICISDKALQKYRTKPLYKENVQIVTQQCKWNKESSNHFVYISEIIKLKISDFNLINTSALKIVQDAAYFIGQNYQKIENNSTQPIPYGQAPQAINLSESYKKKFYILQFKNFFEENKFPIFKTTSNLEKECQDFFIEKSLITKQLNYFWLNQQSIEYSNFKGTKQLMRFEDKELIQILGTLKSSDGYIIFIKTQKGVTLIQQNDSDIQKGNQFMPIKNIKVNSFDLKEGHICYTTNQKVVLNCLGNNKQEIIYRSFGSFIDFKYTKNYLVVQKTDKKGQERLIQLKKNINIHNRVFVGHPKKTILQDIKADQVKNLNKFQLIAAKRKGQPTWGVFQNTNDLKLLIDNLFLCEQTQFIHNKKNINCLFCWDKLKIQLFTQHQHIEGELTSFKSYEFKLQLKSTRQRRNFFLINQYLIWYENKDSKISIFNILTQQLNSVDLPIKKEKLIKVFIERKQITFKKKDKDYFILEITCCCQNTIQIFEMLPKTQQFKLTHKSDNIGQGFAILYPYLDQKSYKNHKYRSITSPQYVLHLHHNIQDHAMSLIVDYQLIESAGKKYLLIITDQEQLYVYQRKICSNHELGFVYQRVVLSLNLIKNWKKGSSNQLFKNLGQSIWRVGNQIFLNGNFIEDLQIIKSFFVMDRQLWAILKDGKIRMIQNISQIVQGYIVSEIPTKIKNQIIGFQAGDDFYCIYNKFGFEILNKQFNLIWSPQINQSNDHLQIIIKIKAYGNCIAMSYFQYYQDERVKQDYQSIKFKIRGYSILHKNKIYEKDKPSQEPITQIQFIAPDKLLLVSTSNVLINTIKNQKTIQTTRTKTFGKRSFLSHVAFIPQWSGSPCYMFIGGSYGGISFHVGQWIQRQILRQLWYDSLKCQIRTTQFFHYGKALKGFIADQQGNVCIMNLKPERSQKLADFNIGSLINKSIVMNQIVHGCFDDGTIRCFTPIKLNNIELTYLDLQQSISQQLPFIGGVNHLQYRMLNQSRRTYKLTRKGNMIDSMLIEDFYNLSKTLKRHVLDDAELKIQEIDQNILKFC